MSSTKLLCGLIIALLYVGLLGCKAAHRPPVRPTSVPETAIWSGGAEGGAWIDCQIGNERNANHCTVYNDQTGDVWKTGFFIIRGENRAASREELKYNGFDGDYIHLSDGRTLDPLP
jgi:hypothetical protein